MNEKEVSEIQRIIKDTNKDLDKAIDGALKKPINKLHHIEFVCPICECTEYEGKCITTGLESIGGRVYPSYYICKGCSVMFKDSDLFSNKRSDMKCQNGKN